MYHNEAAVVAVLSPASRTDMREASKLTANCNASAFSTPIRVPAHPKPNHLVTQEKTHFINSSLTHCSSSPPYSACSRYIQLQGGLRPHAHSDTNRLRSTQPFVTIIAYLTSSNNNHHSHLQHQVIQQDQSVIKPTNSTFLPAVSSQKKQRLKTDDCYCYNYKEEHIFCYMYLASISKHPRFTTSTACTS